MAMARSVQQPLPPMLVQRLDERSEGRIQKVDNALSLEQARGLAADIVAAVIAESGESLKAFGDPSQVKRWTQGENPNLARLIQKTDGRKAMAKALLKSCDDVEVLDEWRVIQKPRTA
jgi:hypothetical protein